jgi:hypothetical protein
VNRTTGLDYEVSEHSDNQNALRERGQCTRAGDRQVVVVKLSGHLDDRTDRHVAECTGAELDDRSIGAYRGDRVGDVETICDLSGHLRASYR